MQPVRFSIMIRLLTVLNSVSIALSSFQPPNPNPSFTFDTCCSTGINKTHAMGIDFLIKESNSDECANIDQLDRIFNEVTNVYDKLVGDVISKCLWIEQGCFYAAKANIFCDNAARNILSSEDTLTPILHFHPELLNSPKDCCKRHNRLPALDVVTGNQMTFDINGVPHCCSVKGYLVPDDLDPFAQVAPETEVVGAVFLKNPPDFPVAVVSNPFDTNIFTNSTDTAPSSMESRAIKLSEIDFNPTKVTSPTEIDLKTEGEIVCGTGFTWHPDRQLCLYTQARCPKGMYLSMSQSKCLPKLGDKFNCQPGFEYRNDLKGCEDINECEEGILGGPACPKADLQCTNMEGSFTCECKPGYKKTQENDCIDIDECKDTPEVCKPGYECRNVIGSFQCIRQVPCGFGYRENIETQECEDIDECVTQPDVCGPNMLCVNVRGGLRCVAMKCPGKLRRNSNGECTPCPSGYAFNDQRKACEDINECESNSTICRPHEKCTNRPGDYICEPKLRCERGFQLNLDGSACEDVDECAMQSFNCRHGQICLNIPGAYRCEATPCHYSEKYDYALARCVCPEGYQHRGAECIDIDECAEEEKHGDPLNPLCNSQEVCVNTVGAFRCVTMTDCPKGFHRTSPKVPCTDINECSNGEAMCGANMHCQNTLGSYRCLCDRGFKNINDTACVDIDECEVFRPDESCPDKRARCVNTDGGFRCICPNGFVWHDYPVYACRDINECALGIDTCGSDHQCVNDEGGYYCECAPGYRLNWDNKTCIDINECLEKGAGKLCESGICVNTEGSYRCDCSSGFRLGNNNTCVDINECEERSGLCTSRHARGLAFSCFNIHGSYRCVSDRCTSMYTKHKLTNGYRCSLMPQYECNSFELSCLKDRPLHIDHFHIELPATLPNKLVLGELNTGTVRRGTVNFELLEHFAYNSRTKRHIAIKDSLKLAVKSSDRRAVELLLIKPIEAPADIFVSVRLSEILGQKSKIRSTSRFYLYATERNNLNVTATS